MSIFTEILLKKPKTSKFDLSHDVKLSFDMGELVPTCAIECLPGDKFHISFENMLRFAPLVSPVMHRIKVKTNYFFVPNRILWSNWEDFITGNGNVAHPYIQMFDMGPVEVLPRSLMDYLGYPVGTFTATDPDDPTYVPKVNPFPIAAYLKIWDEYFRDQNLQSEVYVPLVDGDNTNDYDDWASQSPLRRAWPHDYFTSALPWAQKGDVVQVPLVEQDNIAVEHQVTGDPGKVIYTNGNPADGGDLGTSGVGELEVTGIGQGTYDPNGSLVVDVQAGATDINTLRTAVKLQEWLERNARGGTRYIEQILSHFGVFSSDKRLQRPEYLGGATQNMVISEVISSAQTVANAVEYPVGYMGGHGISVGNGSGINFKCEEHGWIIGVISVVPDTAYQQGLHKSLSRFDKLDYAWPTFAHLGEQSIRNVELKIDHANPGLTFGYIPRYAEYKFMNSRVAGDMRDNLNFWHLGRIFDDDPELNGDFVECSPSKRIFAVADPDVNTVWAHVYNNITAVRRLPKFGVPQL